MCQGLGLWYLDVPSEQSNQMNPMFLMCNLTKFFWLFYYFLSSLLYEITVANDADRLPTFKKKKRQHKNLDVKLCTRMYLDIT